MTTTHDIALLTKNEFPVQLLEIPDPPEILYLRGQLPSASSRLLCVVGARRYTHYGQEACNALIEGLRGLDVWIVSGLALGIDILAHQAALNAGIKTLAIPGSGLNDDVLYPTLNRKIAHEILASGGGLLSEFSPDFKATPWSFPQRNRIMSGISHAVLIIEGEQKSGTFITARLAVDYNKDVLAVPGSIFSKNAECPHALLRLGATPITSPKDLREALGFTDEINADIQGDQDDKLFDDCTPDEKAILDILIEPLSRSDIIESTELPVYKVNISLSLLEMKGYIKESLGLIRKIK